MMRRLLLMMGVALLVVPVGTAGAQGYGTGNFIAVDDATLFQGQTFTVFGCCYSGEVDITIASEPLLLGVATADASGNYSIEVRIPDDYELGGHTVSATGLDLAGNPLSLSTNVIVFAKGGQAADPGKQPGRSGDGLARTGSEPLDLVRWAVVLIGAGAVLHQRQRRAERQQATVSSGR